jgi:hypothetical protein
VEKKAGTKKAAPAKKKAGKAGVSINALAKQLTAAGRPITEGAIRKAIKEGRVPESPTFAQVVAGLQTNTKHLNGGGDRRSERASKGVASMPPMLDPKTGKPLTDAPGSDGQTILELREDRERVALEMDRIKLAEMEGQYIVKADAQRAIRAVWRMLRDQLMGMSQKLGPQLASMSDPKATRVMIDDYVRRTLIDAHRRALESDPDEADAV